MKTRNSPVPRDLGLWLAAFALVGCQLPFGPAPIVPDADGIMLPSGFTIDEFATGLSNPRFMALGQRGVVLVAERGASRIIALPDADGDGRADAVVPVLDGLIAPSSVACHQGRLYVGETTRVTRVDLADDLSISDRTVIIPDLPAGGHSTRTVCFGSDGLLYVSVGSSCNVCIESDPRRAAVSVYDSEGGSGRVFSRGLRNAVGLAVEPTTGRMWASNNGRDLMGDDLPPETIYVLSDGADYGWPRCHSGDIVDPEFGGPSACDGVEPPVVRMQAHMAPLGIAFYDATAFPPEYRGDLFVALHGSWNRSTPVGYSVMRVPIENGTAVGPAVDFATGWLRPDGTASGRPAGLLVTADGALLVSDDAGGRVYRISFGG